MNSNEVNVFSVPGLVASADLSAKQFYAVKLDSSGEVELSGAGESSIGFLRNKPESGEACEILNMGVALAKCGNSVTAGEELMAKSDGTAIPQTSTNAVIGIAMQSGVADDIISVLLSDGSSGNSVAYSTLTIPVTLANIADGDLVTGFTPGFGGTIVSFHFVTTDAVTTAAKLSTINLEIGTTNVTGGALSLTSANAATLGAVVDATAITAANVFTDSDTISIEAASTTTFIEGEGVFVITYKS